MFRVATLHHLRPPCINKKLWHMQMNRTVWRTQDKKPSMKTVPEELQGLDLLDKDANQL